MDADYVVRAEHLNKALRGKGRKHEQTVLRDISMQIPRGQLTALTGPDGAGKTTLLRLICGLLQADSGGLDVLGTPMESGYAAQEGVQARLGYMPQKFGLYEDLSVRENMELYAKLHGLPESQRKERFTLLLRITGLAPFTDRLAGKLSGGMKQKLGLACTLVRSPELLLLDEPTAGVDLFQGASCGRYCNSLYRRRVSP